MEKPSVLVIDDEVEVADEIGAVIKEGGFEVEVVYSGEEGLKRLKEKVFKVVVLDIRMPKMWGTEVLRKIKELKQPLEVIMLTALDDAQNAWESSKYGAFDYITKPFKNEDLIFRIKLAANRALESRKLAEEFKPIANFMKIYSSNSQVYNQVMAKFKETVGDRIMTPQEVREWFSEEKLREIFGSSFKKEWLAEP
jgi:DNA-binding response OmpR family regulator